MMLEYMKLTENVSVAIGYRENWSIVHDWYVFDEQYHVVMCCTIGGQGALSCYRLLLVCKALLSSLLSPCICHRDQSIS